MVRIILRLDLLIKQLLPRRRTLVTQVTHVIKRINRQAIAISTVPDSQLERRVDIALLSVSTDEQVLLALAAICQAVDQPRVRVEVEDAGYVVCEDGLILMRFEAVGVLVLVDELEEVDDVYKTDFEVGKVCAE